MAAAVDGHTVQQAAVAVPLTTPLSVRDCRETSPVYQPFGAVAGDDIGRAH
jgi:hypothetical protein